MASWLNGSSSQDASKQRKRWELEDKKLLKNLRFQLAEDGNSECQFEAAKILLNDADDADLSRQMQGITYLKKAAEQGHENALELLGACYRTRRGINSSNESEIREFLNLSHEERIAQNAARELFNSLCNGNEYVTVEQLEKRMREIYKMQKSHKKKLETAAIENESGEISVQEEIEEGASTSSSPIRVHSTRRTDQNENQISEKNLLMAANSYSHGIIPQVSQALTLSIPHQQSLEHVPFLHRPFFHPLTFFKLLYYRFIEIFSSFPSDTLKRYQFIILLAAYALLSTNANLLISLPTITYYITLVVMIIASFKMLKAKHQFIDFRIWSGLFLSYNERVYADHSENLYLRNNLKPYLWFFTAFAINLMIYPLIADQWLFNSEVTVLSFSLTFITMMCFMSTSPSGLPDLIPLFSFAANILAKYPYEFDSVVSSKWRFLDLKIPGIPSFMIGSGIEFSMNCRGLLYITIMFLLLLLARRRNWHGIYQFLIPHSVTLAWLQLSIINSQASTAFGLMRSALGLAGMLFFLPVFGLATLLIPVFAAVEWMSVADSTNKLFITISTSLIAILGSCCMAISNRTGKYVTYVHILLCLLASFFLFQPYMSVDEGNFYSSYLHESKVAKSADVEESIQLDWEAFHKYCLAPSAANKINLQLRCNQLDGVKIHWDGTVTDVSISKVENWRKSLMETFLPEFLTNFLACYFGEVNKAQCFAGEGCEIKEFIEEQHQRCNLDKWNVYDYEIDVKIMTSANTGILNLNSKQESKIVLKAEHAFKNFTTRLNSLDKIWFKGVLRTSSHSTLTSSSDDQLLACRTDKSTRIEITSIGCHVCVDKDLTPVAIHKYELNIDNHLKSLQRGFKYLVNVLFYPLVTVK